MRNTTPRHKQLFIFDRLRNELDLETVSDTTITFKTVSGQTPITEGQTDFSLELLSTEEKFSVKNAFVMLNFSDDESVLSY